MNSEVKIFTRAKSIITFEGGFSFKGERTTCAAVSIALDARSSMAAETDTTAISPCLRKVKNGSVESEESELALIPGHQSEVEGGQD